MPSDGREGFGLLHLLGQQMLARQPFASSGPVRFEEEVGEEALELSSEEVAAAWLASLRALNGLWS